MEAPNAPWATPLVLRQSPNPEYMLTTFAFELLCLERLTSLDAPHPLSEGFGLTAHLADAGIPANVRARILWGRDAPKARISP